MSCKVLVFGVFFLLLAGGFFGLCGVFGEREGLGAGFGGEVGAPSTAEFGLFLLPPENGGPVDGGIGVDFEARDDVLLPFSLSLSFALPFSFAVLFQRWIFGL